MGMLIDLTLQEFLGKLASGSPAPGGGSAAALAGSLGAALSSMVSNLTIGKEKYQTVQSVMKEALHKSEQLRKQLTQLIDDDTNAFNEVMTAVKLPKETEEQKEKRKQALQAAYQNAAQVPLQTARLCDQVLDVVRIVAEKGNTRSITDAAAAAILSQAGLETALLNVRINLGSLTDERFVQAAHQEINTLERQAKEKTAVILQIVETSL